MKRLRVGVLTGLLAIVVLLPNLASAAGRTHTVQYGETLTSIAAKYGVSVDTLARTNGLASVNLIFVGQTLSIPGGSEPHAAPVSQGASDNYLVQAGDSLSGIATRTGVSVAALAEANGLADTNFIWAGQSLRIPGSAAPAPALTPAAGAAPTSPATPAGAAPAGGTTYAVQRGDTLSSIAARYGVNVDAVAQANGLRDRNLLFAGNVLTIPGLDGARPAAPPPTQGGATAPALPTAPPAPAAPVPPSTPPSTPRAAPGSALPRAGSLVRYVVQDGDQLYAIAAQYNTTVDAILARNNLPDANRIVAGQTLEILVGDLVSKPALRPPSAAPATPVGPPPAPLPPPVSARSLTGKWIDVNLTTETLTAYEGSTSVYSTLVSTGVAWHPTVVGTFTIYAKYGADDMTSGVGAEYYYLPAVPYVMYFYEGGYAIHGTYWHHNFGHPMSHGCVNLSIPAAKWMYDWAPVGTPVTSHW